MDCDVLIVGGGIVGVSVGARLAQALSVTLWEAEENLGYHASGRSAAMFETRYGPAPVIALNRASEPDHKAGNHLSPRGLLLVGMSGEEPAFAHDCKRLGLADLTPAEARALCPILSDSVTRTAHTDSAQDLDTNAIQQVALRTIRRHGGTVTAARPVERITRLKAGWEVRSGDAVTTCRTLVNAAGAWADRVAEMAGIATLGLSPLRRSVARIAAPAGQDVTAWPMLLGAGESWYAKPDAGALLVSPADEDPSEPMDAWPEDLVLAEGLARYEAAVTTAVTRPIASWAGLRTFTPDRVPALGRAKDMPDFVWAAGLGGYGFQSAPAAAQLVADYVLGQAPTLDADAVAALDPGRFL
ncbi:MAG: FAD-binding oxidoreductase [Pseudomonadota bacterium]